MAKGGYQKRRLEQKKQEAKQARRRARRRRLVLTWTATVAVFALIATVAVLALTGSDSDLAADPTDAATPSPTPAALPEGCVEAEPSSNTQTYDAPPPMGIDPEKTYTATMETNCGTMTIELFAGEAPTTVNSFVFLAREGFFDGLLFHRVIDDFMIQGGDPQGTGSGGPGYQFEDENTDRQFDEPGLLAMANSGPGTNGSQFFITEVEVNWLNQEGQCPGAPQGCHSIFGKVVEGMEIIERIVGVPTSEADRPQANVVIQAVTIQER